MSATSRDIATEAAIKIVDTLIYDWGIAVNYVFNFFENSDRYKGLLDDDIMLVMLLQDDSIDDVIYSLGEQIIKKYYCTKQEK